MPHALAAMSPTRPPPPPPARRAALPAIPPVPPAGTGLARAWTEPPEPFPFLAGQWVRLHLPIPGAEEIRNYSIASPPSKADGIELCILTRRGGRAARYLTEELARGDVLRVQGPYGHFHLPDPLDHDPVFATESVGISAIRSILLDLFERGTARRVDLLFSATHENELLYRRELEALPGLTPTWILAHPPEGWAGGTGTLAAAVRERLAAEPGRKVWVSGFEWTVNPVADVLAELGVPADRIEIERYD